MPRIVPLLLVLGWLFAPSLVSAVADGAGVLEPASTGGVEQIDRALQRLAVHRRMLMIGAHPDDEDNALLTYVSRHLAGEAAYLSLSRGEGGQNLVGAELGDALGVVRTGELEAARALEGSRQYFTRAFDFGYTRSLDETLEAWPPAALAEDVARVVERFKPQIVVSIFPGDGRGRHGQHQAAGVLANALFEDPPGPVDRLEPLRWTPSALYRRPWWSPTEADFEVPLGAIDPHSGRSIGQLAAASRSRHRSQDMGRLQRLGTHSAGLQRIYGPPVDSIDGLFDGIDTRLEAIADLLPDGDLQDDVRGELTAVRQTAVAARGRLTLASPEVVVGDLATICRRLRLLGERLAAASGPAAATASGLIVEKRQVAVQGLLAAAGIAVDAVADREELVAGEAATVEIEVWNAGGGPLVVESTAFSTAPGWQVLELDHPVDDPTVETEARGADRVERHRWRLEVEPTAEPTVPYYLVRPRRGALYDWAATPEASRGEASGTPPAVARLRMRLADEPVEVEREVVYRRADQAVGEVRRPLRAVPVLEVEVSPELIVAPLSRAEPLVLEIAVRSRVGRAVSGAVELDLPDGWSIDGDLAFEIADPRGRATRSVRVTPALDARSGRFELGIYAVHGGARYGASYPIVEYPHIRPVSRVLPARVRVERLDLHLPKLERVGYVRGAADRVPESLRRVGVPVDLLDGRAVAGADLSAYDAIVVGSRAYETDPALRESNPRLLRFAEEGGLLIVQYQQYQFVEGSYAPYPLAIGRPHDRVTDESSPYRVLSTTHPVFNHPNPIGEADWRGWVQERGLYFAGEWDSAYEPLLGLTDVGLPEQRGGLLVAPYGSGTYVYTGLSFFRQLPAGIPGAYRLFANLLGLAKEPNKEVSR